MDPLLQAAAQLDAQVVLSPNNVSLRLDAALAHFQTGRTDRTALHARVALSLRPTTAADWARLTRVLGRVPLDVRDATLEGDLLACLTADGADAEALSETVADVLWAVPDAAGLRAGDVEDALHSKHWMGRPLLRMWLQRCQLTHPGWEQVVTAFRGQFLERALSGKPARFEEELPFVAAVATAAFNAEYAWDVTPDEATLVAALAAPWTQEKVLALAMYRPLSGQPADVVRVLGRTAPETAWLVGRTVDEPREEARLAATLPSLSAFAGKASPAVAAQYEENPYPRWMSLPYVAPTTLRGYFEERLPYADLPDDIPEPKRILVAGCGTGRHALLVARRFPNAQVVGVDLSRRALAYAVRATANAGVRNVSFAQADLVALEGLPRFDVIEAVGVLHHLFDPMEGWRALLKLLKPKGWMCVGLYSQLARAAVFAAREVLDNQKLGVTQADLRRGRTVLRALPGNHLAAGVTHSPDFASLSGCRDLLRHAQEHVYTLPRVANALDALKLSFEGFEVDWPSLHAGYGHLFPQDPHHTNLVLWDRFEQDNPQLFGGMYVFWCTRERPARKHKAR